MKGSITRKLYQIPRGHLLVGIDPHKKKHAVAIITPQAMVISKFKVNNSLDGFTHLCLQVARFKLTLGLAAPKHRRTLSPADAHPFSSSMVPVATGVGDWSGKIPDLRTGHFKIVPAGHGDRPGVDPGVEGDAFVLQQGAVHIGGQPQQAAEGRDGARF